MEKSKPGVCTTCNITEGSSCSKWCAGCTLHKLLRVLIIVVAICAAYSFGHQVGMIKAILMSDGGLIPRQQMMYHHNIQNDRMMLPTADTTTPATETPAASSTTTKPEPKN